MPDGLKQQWSDLRKGRPGHRFQERYERKQSWRREQSWMQRFGQPAIGVLILGAGIIFCFIPGPGLPLVVVGGALLAERSRPIARTMDWCELKFRKTMRSVKGWWCHASLAARNAAILLAAFVIASAGYGAYQILIHR
ncbi:MAG TPA: PGPGW domain-containing protein [Verrucomicrobiae bacterium]|nr:PGPGW domain-containing protein [Verrucomicrobiae bacterium]